MNNQFVSSLQPATETTTGFFNSFWPFALAFVISAVIIGVIIFIVQTRIPKEKKLFRTWFKSDRNILSFLLILIPFLILSLVILWYLLDYSGGKHNENIKIMLQAGAGILVFLGLYLTYRRIKASEEQVEALREQIRVTEDGQITERFTRAVDQLGNPATEIQLGGIYALERISQESDRDYWPIMEILTGYIRHKSPTVGAVPEEGLVLDFLKGPELAPKITMQVQAALTVVARRKYEFGHVFEPGRIDLSNTNLRGAYLNDAKLQGAYLNHSILLDAFLHDGQLQQADIASSWLNDAELMRANLSNSWLIGSKLHRANLFGANFQSAKLEGADLRQAIIAEPQNLDWRQLEFVKTLYQANLDPVLEAELRDNDYGHLIDDIPDKDPDESQ